MSYARQMLGTCPVSFNVDAGLLATYRPTVKR